MTATGRVMLEVWEDSGEYFMAEPHEEPRIDAAVTRYLSSGRTLDSVISIDLIDGRDYKVRASAVKSWTISTPDTRSRDLELTHEFQEEKTRSMRALGIWDDEEL